MAKLYRDPKTLQHIPHRDGRSLAGTLRYMSLNTHCGHEQSRRDDLEALGNAFIYFLRGRLPWQNIKAATKQQRSDAIKKKKQTTSIRELCEGFPVLEEYFNYVRNLEFEAAPDYDYLRRHFSSALRATGELDDGSYDWNKLKTLEEDKDEAFNDGT